MLNNYKKRAMKKLLVVLGVGLLFASCETQPNLDARSINPLALKQLKHGRVDTVLVVETDKNDYQKYEYHFFKNDKEQTFKGSVHRYNENETGFVIMGCIGIIGGIFLGAILFNN
jgi:hypothetical protein